VLSQLTLSSEQRRAQAVAADYEALLEQRHAGDLGFFTWNSNRSLDFQDFDYQFYHRINFSEAVRTQLEYIAAKISYTRRDGKPGYFNKLERNIGWTRGIAPLVRCRVNNAEKLVRCGLWSSARNSGRCHLPDCPYCHWVDVLHVKIQSFGADSGTFERMQQADLTATFITLGYTSNQANSKKIGRDFANRDISHLRGSPIYDPYPVRLGLDDDDGDCAFLGYQDAKLLGIITQTAVEKVYKKRLLAGYHFKIEGQFKLVPGGANRVNLHAHIVANGYESPQTVADALFVEMKTQLYRRRKHLNGKYFADVQVLRLNSAQELARVISYSDKPIPFSRIVEEAMTSPEAKRADGSWDPAYVDMIQTALVYLVNDDIPSMFSGSMDRLFKCLRRRKSAGNMRFSDRGKCIGDEPNWHRKIRHKRAKWQRDARLKAKARELEVEVSPAAVQSTQRKRRIDNGNLVDAQTV
jgi:hypothetical protein